MGQRPVKMLVDQRPKPTTSTRVNSTNLSARVRRITSQMPISERRKSQIMSAMEARNRSNLRQLPEITGNCPSEKQEEMSHISKRLQANSQKDETSIESFNIKLRNKNCQPAKSNCCYRHHLMPLIYILIQLLLISATSSQATSHIRSIWVSKDDITKRSDQEQPLLNSTTSSGRQQLDVERASAGKSKKESKKKANGNKPLMTAFDFNVEKATQDKNFNDLSGVYSNLHTSATSLQPVAIAAPEQDGDLSSNHKQAARRNQQPEQVAQRRSSQTFGSDSDGGASLSSAHDHALRLPPRFKIANLSSSAAASFDETVASSLDNSWTNENRHQQRQRQSGRTPVNTTNAGASVSNAQVHFDDLDHHLVSAPPSRQNVTSSNDARFALFNASAPPSDLTPRQESGATASQAASQLDLPRDNNSNYNSNNNNNKTAHSERFGFGPAYPVLTDETGRGSAHTNEHDNLLPEDRPDGLLDHHQNNGGNLPAPQPPPPQNTDQPPSIYYLADGDKWNHEEPQHDEDENRAHRHHYHEQQQQQHENRKLQGDSGNSQHWPNAGAALSYGFLPPTSSAAPAVNAYPNPLGNFQQQQQQQQPPPSLLSTGNYHNTNHLFADNNQAHDFVNEPYLHQVTTTTPTPPPSPPLQPLYHHQHFPVEALTEAIKQQRHLAVNQYTSPTALAGNQHFYPGRRQATAPTMLPMSLHQYIGNENNYLSPAPLRSAQNNRQMPAPRSSSRNQRPINVGETPTQASGSQRSSFPLFRNYSPMQLIGGAGGGNGNSGKSKKSLLSTLNEKLNTWTSGASSASEADVKHLIESSFFQDDTRDSQIRRRRRPPGPSIEGVGNHLSPIHSHVRNLHHNYNLPPLPRPPMQLYGPIRQPTVAPASSSLSNFYGHLPSAQYYPIKPVSHLRLNQQAQPREQLQQQMGSQGQAASFIPVVAVQVTRTSPAPSLQSEQTDSQQQHHHADSAPSHSTTANEIDEYLAAKIGKQQQSASGGGSSSGGSSNLNYKQKWDDSYGSATAATLRDYQNQQQRNHNAAFDQHFYNVAPSSSLPPKSRRRHAPTLASSPGAPQHETTIKGAVFGYLPHQADAPLMQAMSMLQQLPASQVRHYHHQAGSAHNSATQDGSLTSPLSQQQHITSHLGSANNPTFTFGSDAASAEMYANQMDRSQQSVDAATPPLDYQSLVAIASAAAATAAANQQQHQELPQLPVQPEDTPMSLALQLQANNYVQNDIAHPFGPQAFRSLNQYNPQQSPNSGTGKQAPLDVIYPSHATGGVAGASSDHQQLHYPAFQFMSPSQLNAYQDYLTQLIANPLFMAGKQPQQQQQQQQQQQSSSGSSQAQPHPFQGYTKQQHEQLPSLITAPNDLNPLLMSSPFLFQHSPEQLAAFQYHMEDPSQTSSPAGDKLSSSSEQLTTESNAGSAQQENSNNNNEQQTDEQQQQDSATSSTTTDSSGSSDTAQRNRDINKNRKRSGDFFASAGQLLLSALPLLLAPTLGLMFASSPSITAARYHNSAGAHLSQASGMPASGPGSLDDGFVVNASPAPQVFTPSPLSAAPYGAASNYAPDSNLYSTGAFSLTDKAPNESAAVSLVGAADESTSQPTQTQAPPPSVTYLTANNTKSQNKYDSINSNKSPYYKSSNSLPALIGFRLDGGAGARNRSAPSGTSANNNNNNKSSTTTTHKPFAIIITTSGPSGENASLNRSSDLNSSGSGGGLGDSNQTRPTVLVLDSDDNSLLQDGSVLDETTTMAPGEMVAVSAGSSSDYLQGKSVPRRDQQRQQVQNVTYGNEIYNQPTRRSSSSSSSSSSSFSDLRETPTIATTTTTTTTTSSTTTRAPPIRAYDGNYEGADFDAQYATLQRKSDVRRETLLQPPPPQTTTLPLINNINKYVKDKNHYQYDKMPAAPPRPSHTTLPGRWITGPTNSLQNLSSFGSADDDPAKGLYPVSSWPSSMTRRKTVSLITSSGNKTLYDSSDRYGALGLMSPGNVNRTYNLMNQRVINNSKHRHQMDEGESIRRVTTTTENEKSGTGSGDQMNALKGQQRNDAHRAPSTSHVVYDDEHEGDSNNSNRPSIVNRISSRLEIGADLKGDDQAALRAKSGSTASTARQQLNKRRFSSLDNFVVASSAHSPGGGRDSERFVLRRRKRALISGPLDSDLPSRLVVSTEQSAIIDKVKKKKPPTKQTVKATGQVVKMKKSKRRRKLPLVQVMKRVKPVERRQDVDDYGQEQQNQILAPTSDYRNNNSDNSYRAYLDAHLVNQANLTTSLTMPSGGGGGGGGPEPVGFRVPTQLQAPALPDIINRTRSDDANNNNNNNNNMRAYERNSTTAGETLRRDASKSKSAIVTAMITHLGNSDSNDHYGHHDHDQADLADDGESNGSGGDDSSSGMSREELREQLLAKKMLLDRLATRAGSAAAPTADEHVEPEQMPEFNAGGRGRFKPAPVLDYVPYGLDQPQAAQNFSATRFMNNRVAAAAAAAATGRGHQARSRQRLRNHNSSSSSGELSIDELNEDTKSALAKFGTLLLEDSLEQQVPPNWGGNRRRSLSSKPRYSASMQSSGGGGNGIRRDDAPFIPAARANHSSSSAYDSYEGGSATERYSTRATQAPTHDSGDQASGGGGGGGGWSHHYSDNGSGSPRGDMPDQSMGPQSHLARKSTRLPPPPPSDEYELPPAPAAPPRQPMTHNDNQTPLTYQYPSRRRHTSNNSNNRTGQSELDSNYENFDSTRTQGGSRRPAPPSSDDYAPGNGHASYSAASSQQHDVGGQAVAFKTHGPHAGTRSSPPANAGDNSPIGRYNNFLASHVSANRTLPGGPRGVLNTSDQQHQNHGHSGNASEQLDARYSTYSNHSTVAPAYSQDAHYNYDQHHHHQPQPQPHDHRGHLPHAHYERSDRYDSNTGRQHYDHEQLPPPPPPPTPYNPHAYQHPHADNPHYYNYYNQSSGGGSSSYQPPSNSQQHYYRPLPAEHQRQSTLDDYLPPPPAHHYPSNPGSGSSALVRNQTPLEHPSASRYYPHGPTASPNYYHGTNYNQPPPAPAYHANHANHHNHHLHQHLSSSTSYTPAPSYQSHGERTPPPFAPPSHSYRDDRAAGHQEHYSRANEPAVIAAAASRSTDSTKAVSDYLKRVQFSDSDRDKLMASYLTCDGLLNDNDHCLERLSCEFSDPQNIEKANKLDRAVSSILLGHILINTYIPNAFKLRLKSASLFGYTQSGKCTKFACSKLANKHQETPSSSLSSEESKTTKSTTDL